MEKADFEAQEEQERQLKIQAMQGQATGGEEDVTRTVSNGENPQVL